MTTRPDGWTAWKDRAPTCDEQLHGLYLSNGKKVMQIIPHIIMSGTERNWPYWRLIEYPPLPARPVNVAPVARLWGVYPIDYDGEGRITIHEIPVEFDVSFLRQIAAMPNASLKLGTNWKHFTTEDCSMMVAYADAVDKADPHSMR